MERRAINDNDLQNVVGGKLEWGNGDVYTAGQPDLLYHYNDYPACVAYIKANWPGGAHGLKTLKMLEEAGLVWKG